MNDYQFTYATDYINQKYNSVLSRLNVDEKKRLEQNLLLGETFEKILPVTPETPLNIMLLLALALDPYLPELRLLPKSAGIMYNEQQALNETGIAADWAAAKDDLNKFLINKNSGKK